VTLRHGERGQATVILVICLVVLLGMAALVLDVGTWFQAQRQTQAAADAAALAAAQALPQSATTARTLAQQYLTKNGGGTANVSVRRSFVADDTVTVTVSRQAPGFFARVFGIDAVDVNAKATARIGTLAGARWAAPFAVDELHPKLQCKPEPCFGDQAQLELEKIGPGAFRLLNLDRSHGGVGPSILEEWILRGHDGEMAVKEWYYSDPGTKFNSSHVRSALDARLDDELLFPVYRKTRASGANFEYEVVGWVGYVLEDYHVQGSKLSWLKGYFTKLIWEGIQSTTGGGPNFGANTIQLVE
jgi:secretion/DNA translocation related TadE-like protein